MAELVVRRDDRAEANPIELGATRTAEDLQHVQNAQIHEGRLLRIVDLRALDDHRVRRQVHAPRQGRRATQHADEAFGEQPLYEVPVRTQHSSVVHREARLEEVLEHRGLLQKDVTTRPTHYIMSFFILIVIE